MPSERRPPPRFPGVRVPIARLRRALLVASAALVAATALGSLAFWSTLDARLPTDADWRAANARIQAEKRDGDLVVLAPDWATRGRDFLTAAPVAPGFDLARDVYPDTRRQWLVALADAPRFDLAAARDALRARASAVGEGARVGGLWVEPFEIAGPVRRFSFTDAVAKATVSLEGVRAEPCRWLAGEARHQCPRGSWNHVRAATFELGERPLRCLWAHPVDRESLRLRFAGVPHGARVAGRGGFVGQSFRSGPPVQLALRVDGAEAGRTVFASVAGIQAFSLPVPEGAGPHVVELDVTAERSGMRHFCFDAWVEPPVDDPTAEVRP
jgi:hypothetical protein